MAEIGALIETGLTSLEVAPPSRILGAAAFFDGVPDHGFQRDAIEPTDLLKPGGRGYIDLGEPIANNVNADEDQTLLFQDGTDRFTDGMLSRR